MGYRTMVENYVHLAFKLVGDLAKTVVLNKRTNSTFNFTTLAVRDTEAAGITTLAVIENTKKSTTEHNARVSSMMLKTKDIGDINHYDSVMVDSVTYKIGPVISTDSYITTVEIYKEG